MLGQGEKSGFRRKLGMLMVGASTVVALPMTATVVYAESDVAEEAHDASADKNMHVEKEVKVTVDEDGKEKKVVKIRKYKGTAKTARPG